ncbi:hypothetical protein DDW09_04540 [Sulfolobus sp. SCGC AB-777_L09]|nr:hypothetical protein DDW09_04540 [Sulfolobus sp. SCGC AB-777_L09]
MHSAARGKTSLRNCDKGTLSTINLSFSSTLITEGGKIYEARNGEELKSILDKVRGEKYEVRVKGVWSLS